MKTAIPILMMTACCTTICAAAESPMSLAGPSLDLVIEYYTKVRTPEGVTREARYKERMVRRPGHVWVERILAKPALAPRGSVNGHGHVTGRDAATAGTAGHAELNHAVTPHHVWLEHSRVRIEYVDKHSRAVIAIPESEYANVNFDGSWINSFFLIDPQLVATMPRSARKAAVSGARWYEREKNGTFERVLWDPKRKIPLMMEKGDRAATFYQRIEVNILPTLGTSLPWVNVNGYSQKEFSDFLD